MANLECNIGQARHPLLNYVDLGRRRRAVVSNVNPMPIEPPQNVVQGQPGSYRQSGFRKLRCRSWNSIRRWEKENELLFAMIEDESEWIATLFPNEVIAPEYFFFALEDGVLLCKLAQLIQEYALKYCTDNGIECPIFVVKYHKRTRTRGQLGQFLARENVHMFLNWCRIHRIPEVILFESNDIVQTDDLREGAREVVICLMEVARMAYKYGVKPPKLVLLENEIELEERAEEHRSGTNSPSSVDSGVDTENFLLELKVTQDSVDGESISHVPHPTANINRSCIGKQSKGPASQGNSSDPVSLPKSELDERVQTLVKEYDVGKIYRLKEGKYIILGRVMFVRMLNDHLLVRIGGGWDGLEHYLMTHSSPRKQLRQGTPEQPITPACQSRATPSPTPSAWGKLKEKFRHREGKSVLSSALNVDQQLPENLSPLTSASPTSWVKGKDRQARKNSKYLLTEQSDEKEITAAIRRIESTVSESINRKGSRTKSADLTAIRNNLNIVQSKAFSSDYNNTPMESEFDRNETTATVIESTVKYVNGDIIDSVSSSNLFCNGDIMDVKQDSSTPSTETAGVVCSDNLKNDSNILSSNDEKSAEDKKVKGTSGARTTKQTSTKSASKVESKTGKPSAKFTSTKSTKHAEPSKKPTSASSSTSQTSTDKKTSAVTKTVSKTTKTKSAELKPVGKVVTSKTTVTTTTSVTKTSSDPTKKLGKPGSAGSTSSKSTKSDTDSDKSKTKTAKDSKPTKPTTQAPATKKPSSATKKPIADGPPAKSTAKVATKSEASKTTPKSNTGKAGPKSDATKPSPKVTATSKPAPKPALKVDAVKAPTKTDVKKPEAKKDTKQSTVSASKTQQKSLSSRPISAKKPTPAADKESKAASAVKAPAKDSSSKPKSGATAKATGVGLKSSDTTTKEPAAKGKGASVKAKTLDDKAKPSPKGKDTSKSASKVMSKPTLNEKNTAPSKKEPKSATPATKATPKEKEKDALVKNEKTAETKRKDKDADTLDNDVVAPVATVTDIAATNIIHSEKDQYSDIGGPVIPQDIKPEIIPSETTPITDADSTISDTTMANSFERDLNTKTESDQFVDDLKSSYDISTQNYVTESVSTEYILEKEVKLEQASTTVSESVDESTSEDVSVVASVPLQSVEFNEDDSQMERITNVSTTITKTESSIVVESITESVREVCSVCDIKDIEFSADIEADEKDIFTSEGTLDSAAAHYTPDVVDTEKKTEDTERPTTSISSLSATPEPASRGIWTPDVSDAEQYPEIRDADEGRIDERRLVEISQETPRSEDDILREGAMAPTPPLSLESELPSVRSTVAKPVNEAELSGNFTSPPTTDTSLKEVDSDMKLEEQLELLEKDHQQFESYSMYSESCETTEQQQQLEIDSDRLKEDTEGGQLLFAEATGKDVSNSPSYDDEGDSVRETETFESNINLSDKGELDTGELTFQDSDRDREKDTILDSTNHSDAQFDHLKTDQSQTATEDPIDTKISYQDDTTVTIDVSSKENVEPNAIDDSTDLYDSVKDTPTTKTIDGESIENRIGILAETQNKFTTESQEVYPNRLQTEYKTESTNDFEPKPQNEYTTESQEEYPSELKTEYKTEGTTEFQPERMNEKTTESQEEYPNELKTEYKTEGTTEFQPERMNEKTTGSQEEDLNEVKTECETESTNEFIAESQNECTTVNQEEYPNEPKTEYSTENTNIFPTLSERNYEEDAVITHTTSGLNTEPDILGYDTTDIGKVGESSVELPVDDSACKNDAHEEKQGDYFPEDQDFSSKKLSSEDDQIDILKSEKLEMVQDSFTESHRDTSEVLYKQDYEVLTPGSELCSESASVDQCHAEDRGKHSEEDLLEKSGLDSDYKDDQPDSHQDGTDRVSYNDDYREGTLDDDSNLTLEEPPMAKDNKEDTDAKIITVGQDIAKADDELNICDEHVTQDVLHSFEEISINEAQQAVVSESETIEEISMNEAQQASMMESQTAEQSYERISNEQTSVVESYSIEKKESGSSDFEDLSLQCKQPDEQKAYESVAPFELEYQAESEEMRHDSRTVAVTSDEDLTSSSAPLEAEDANDISEGNMEDAENTSVDGYEKQVTIHPEFIHVEKSPLHYAPLASPDPESDEEHSDSEDESRLSDEEIRVNINGVTGPKALRESAERDDLSDVEDQNVRVEDKVSDTATFVQSSEQEPDEYPVHTQVLQDSFKDNFIEDRCGTFSDPSDSSCVAIQGTEYEQSNRGDLESYQDSSVDVMGDSCSTDQQFQQVSSETNGYVVVDTGTELLAEQVGNGSIPAYEFSDKSESTLAEGVSENVEVSKEAEIPSQTSDEHEDSPFHHIEYDVLDNNAENVQKSDVDELDSSIDADADALGDNSSECFGDNSTSGQEQDSTTSSTQESAANYQNFMYEKGTEEPEVFNQIVSHEYSETSVVYDGYNNNPAGDQGYADFNMDHEILNGENKEEPTGDASHGQHSMEYSDDQYHHENVLGSVPVEAGTMIDCQGDVSYTMSWEEKHSHQVSSTHYAYDADDADETY